MNIENAATLLRQNGLKAVIQEYGIIGGSEILSQNTEPALLSVENVYFIRKNNEIWVSQYQIGQVFIFLEASRDLLNIVNSIVNWFALMKAMPDDFEKICTVILNLQEIKLITRVDITGAISVFVLDGDREDHLTAYEYQIQRANANINDLLCQFVICKRIGHWEIRPFDKTAGMKTVDIPDVNSVVMWLDKHIKR